MTALNWGLAPADDAVARVELDLIDRIALSGLGNGAADNGTGAQNAAMASEEAADTASGAGEPGASEMAIGTTYNVLIVYSGDPRYRPAFDAAEARWEQIITGEIPDVNTSSWGLIDDLRVDARIETIDGVGGILGSAGPDGLRSGSRLPYHGNMRFDSADVENLFVNGQLANVILHEIGHIIGIGTIWDDLGLQTGARYTGANALAEYRTLSGNPGATFVPVETDGGPGTAFGHWDEDTFDNELMTGFLDSGRPNPISRMTIGALRDFGYTVELGVADAYQMPGGPPQPPPSGSTPPSALPPAGPPADKNDFNGDGRADILWQNDNGTPGIWLMDGFNRLAGANVGFNPSPSWKVKDAGDFNSDGHADILWQNTNGMVSIWLMDGLNRIAEGGEAFNPGPTWKIKDTGDFNGDGRSDILWQNDNGAAGIWLMNGLSRHQDSGIGFNPGPTWKVKAAGDFNGDGKADILWQNDNGAAGIWLMNGLNRIADSGIGFNPGPSWKIKDAGDFNADGKADILWQNDNGTPGIWLMDGFNRLADGGVGFNPGPTWKVKSASDYNGDGKADILWQDDNGAPGLWLMNGLAVIAESGIGFDPGPSWKVIEHADLI